MENKVYVIVVCAFLFIVALFFMYDSIEKSYEIERQNIQIQQLHNDVRLYNETKNFYKYESIKWYVGMTCLNTNIKQLESFTYDEDDNCYNTANTVVNELYDGNMSTVSQREFAKYMSISDYDRYNNHIKVWINGTRVYRANNSSNTANIMSCFNMLQVVQNKANGKIFVVDDIRLASNVNIYGDSATITVPSLPLTVI